MSRVLMSKYIRNVAVPVCCMVVAVFASAVLLVGAPSQAHAASVPQLYSDTLIPDGATIPIVVKAQLDQNATRAKSMQLIKQYRQEALNEGIVKLPSGMSRNKYLNGFVWDADLERIAIQRAAEAAVVPSHTRPVALDFYYAFTQNTMSSGEILAWDNSRSIEGGFRLWKSEKADYIKKIRGQSNYGETGHYEAIIDPNNTSYGFCWTRVAGTGYSCHSGEFSRGTKNSGSVGYKGTYDVTIPVRETGSWKVSLSATAKDNPLMPGYTTQIATTAKISTAPGVKANVVASKMNYKSSKTAIATVNAKGVAKGLKNGSTAITVSGGGKTAKVNLTVATTQPMYRLYNPKTGEHLYTKSSNEKKVLSTQRGWKYEGIAWYAPVKSSIPVYRLYQEKSKAHHYTTSKNERDTLVKKSGWTYEGICWYSDTGKGVPVYRVAHPKKPMIAAHHFTVKSNEVKVLTTQRGWKYEGVAWYGYKQRNTFKK